MLHLRALAALLVAALSVPAAAAPPTPAANPAPGEIGVTIGPATKLPLPRYVSLKTDRVNLREGPSKDHRTLWVFQRAGLPVEIIAEFETWRRIRDSEGTEGWVLHSLLSGRRTAVVLSRGADKGAPVPLYDRADATVYFTKIAEAGLFRLNAQSGTETLVTREVNPAHLDGWMVLAGHVFYIGAKAIGPSDVHELDPATGEDRIVATIPDSIADFNFSVSHDRSQIVVVRIAAQDTDVGAITLHHDSAG